MAASIRGLARTYVSYSARLARAETFAGAPAAGSAIGSLFLVAGELDPGGRAADAQALFDLAAEPRTLTVHPATADHGIAILENQPDARPQLFAWLAANL